MTVSRIVCRGGESDRIIGWSRIAYREYLPTPVLFASVGCEEHGRSEMICSSERMRGDQNYTGKDHAHGVSNRLRHPGSMTSCYRMPAPSRRVGIRTLDTPDQVRGRSMRRTLSDIHTEEQQRYDDPLLQPSRLLPDYVRMLHRGATIHPVRISGGL